MAIQQGVSKGNIRLGDGQDAGNVASRRAMGRRTTDISTHEERRAYRIARQSLKAIDSASNEVIAERVGCYMMDPGQESRGAVEGRGWKPLTTPNLSVHVRPNHLPWPGIWRLA